MKTELIVLPKELKEAIELSSVNLSKAEKIASKYAPLMNEVTEQMQLIKGLKKGSEEDVEKAKRIRLDLGKICSKANDLKKADKDLLLLETRFIDGLFNAVNGAARLTQEDAKEIEKHFENLETERLEKLSAERKALILPFEEVDTLTGLGYMEQSIWENVLLGAKTSHEARISAAKKIEEERILKEKAEAEEKIRVEKENKALKIEAEAREKQAEKERIEREQKEALRVTAEKKEREAQEEKSRKEKEAHELQLKKQREETEKIEKELRAKKDAEAKAEAERKAEAEAELNKGDSAKVTDLICELVSIKTKYSFKSKKNQKMFLDIQQLIDKVVNHIK